MLKSSLAINKSHYNKLPYTNVFWTVFTQRLKKQPIHSTDSHILTPRWAALSPQGEAPWNDTRTQM